MNSYFSTLSDQIRKLCTTDQNSWFDSAIERLLSSEEPTDQLATLITQTRRNMGNDLLAGKNISFDTPAGTLFTDHWSLTDATRIALILSLNSGTPDETIKLVSDLYKLSDEAEHVSIVKGLVLYSNDDSLKPVALEAGRTNSRPLFSALALNNPYPAAHYSEHEFNQMVLKALFTGLNIDALQGLLQRSNPELSRMSEDYLEERVAADRSVPADIWLALAPYRSEQGEKLLISALSNEDVRHRFYSAKAVMQTKESSSAMRNALNTQLKAETNDHVREMIRDALTN